MEEVSEGLSVEALEERVREILQQAWVEEETPTSSGLDTWRDMPPERSADICQGDLSVDACLS